MEELRSLLGLPTTGRPQSPTPSADPLDPGPDTSSPLPRLAALGRQLAANTHPHLQHANTPASPDAVAATSGIPASSGSSSGANLSSEVAVARARRHLACSAAEQLPLSHLPLLLADCQALLRQRTAAAWAALEEEGRAPSAGGKHNVQA